MVIADQMLNYLLSLYCSTEHLVASKNIGEKTPEITVGHFGIMVRRKKLEKPQGNYNKYSYQRICR